MDKESLRNNMQDSFSWVRLLQSLFFLLVLQVAYYIFLLVAVFQMIARLCAGAPYGGLRNFSSSLSVFLLHCVRFVLSATDEKPFPFTPWPEPNPEDFEGFQTEDSDEGDNDSEEPPPAENPEPDSAQEDSNETPPEENPEQDPKQNSKKSSGKAGKSG